MQQFVRETEKSLAELKVAENRAESYEKQVTDLKNDIVVLQGQHELCVKRANEKDRELEALTVKHKALTVKHEESMLQMCKTELQIRGINEKQDLRLKQISGKDEQLLDLKKRHEEALNQLHEKDQHIVSLNQKNEESLNNMNEKSKEYKEQIKERDLHIIDLSRQHEEAWKRMNKKMEQDDEQQIQRLNDHILSLQRLLQESHKRNREHEEQTHESDNKLVALSRQHEEDVTEIREKDHQIQHLKSMLNQFIGKQSKRRERESESGVPSKMIDSPWSMKSTPKVRRQRSGGKPIPSPGTNLGSQRSNGSMGAVRHQTSSDSEIRMRRMRSDPLSNLTPDVRIGPPKSFGSARSAGGSRPGTELNSSTSRPSSAPGLGLDRQKLNLSAGGIRRQRLMEAFPPRKSPFDESFRIRRQRSNGSTGGVRRQRSSGSTKSKTEATIPLQSSTSPSLPLHRQRSSGSSGGVLQSRSSPKSNAETKIPSPRSFVPPLKDYETPLRSKRLKYGLRRQGSGGSSKSKAETNLSPSKSSSDPSSGGASKQRSESFQQGVRTKEEEQMRDEPEMTTPRRKKKRIF